MKTFFDTDGYVQEKQKCRDKYLTQGSHRAVWSQFAVGDRVWAQDTHTKRWDIEATVQSIRDSGRSYWIVTPEGGMYLRNRKYLAKNKGCADDQGKRMSANLVSAPPTE